METVAANPSLISQIASPQKTANEKKARETAEDFEAVFIAQMLEPMFQGIKTDGPFGGGHSEAMFRSMQNEQVAKEIARSGGIGIADAIYRQILELQEGAAHAAAQ